MKKNYIKNEFTSSGSLGAKWQTLKRLKMVSSSRSSSLDYFTPVILNDHSANTFSKSTLSIYADLKQVIQTLPVDTSRLIFDFCLIIVDEVHDFITEAPS